MIWRIDFTGRSRKEFKQLDQTIQRRITNFLNMRVAENPRRIGDALTGNKKGFWRYRIGDYRVIADIKDKEILILVVRVGHRREVYD